jgi:bacteriorhodopsin
MLLAAALSILASLFSSNRNILLVLFIEILITSVSSYMYYLFTNRIKGYQLADQPIKYGDINILRYNGWAITTPLMLIALCLFLQNSTKITISASLLFLIIVLDYLMLGAGYLGESGYIDRTNAMVAGFIPFFAIFWIIYSIFLRGKFNAFNTLIFGIYFLIWSGYGVSYLFEDNVKTTFTNLFDLMSKAVVSFLLSINYISQSLQ